MENRPHQTVLKNEVIDFLAQAESLLSSSDPLFLDGTFGRGGHTLELLQRIPDAKVIAIDRDPDAIEFGGKLRDEMGFRERLFLFEGEFSSLKESAPTIKEALSIAGDEDLVFDGIMLDLGVSSPQLDQAERGFSFQKDGPLDMRMDQGENTMESAADLVNRLPEKDLADVIYQYGEERYSRKIARVICEKRLEKPFETTRELSKIIEAIYPKPKKGKPLGIHPSTRTFQALRIAVNQELSHLEEILKDATMFLRQGGRICVISFHSLEDRIVKKTFRDSRQAGSDDPMWKVITKKPVIPQEEEMNRNPRARSAKFRCAEKPLKANSE